VVVEKKHPPHTRKTTMSTQARGLRQQGERGAFARLLNFAKVKKLWQSNVMLLLYCWWLVRLCLNTSHAKKTLDGTPKLEEE